VSRLTPRRILVGAWLAFVLVGYPGYMRPDGVDELVDSRTGAITDWHSPMLTELWRVLGRLIAGPAPLFLLQGTMLLLGAYALARRGLPERRAAAAAAAVLLFPPLLSTTVLVSEDATLTAFVVCGAALLLANHRLAGLALLGIAAGLQEGAALAVLPIVLVTLRWDGVMARWKGLAAAFVVWAAIVGVAYGLVYLLVDQPTHRRGAALAMVDIAGTLGHARALEDAQVRRMLPGVSFSVATELQRHARANRMIEAPTTQSERDGLIAGRDAISRALPLAYLRARMEVFARVLGWTRDKGWRTWNTNFVPSPKLRLGIAHDAHHSVLQRALAWPGKVLSRTLLFRPFVYFVLGLVLAPIAFVRRNGLAAMVLVSGLLYELALGIVTAAPEYRDSHWMMVATCFAGLLLALEVRHERLEQQAALGVAEHDRRA
jgi:hypothetical protein